MVRVAAFAAVSRSPAGVTLPCPPLAGMHYLAGASGVDVPVGLMNP
jgi:hypothetical protein